MNFTSIINEVNVFGLSLVVLLICFIDFLGCYTKKLIIFTFVEH